MKQLIYENDLLGRKPNRKTKARAKMMAQQEKNE